MAKKKSGKKAPRTAPKTGAVQDRAALRQVAREESRATLFELATGDPQAPWTRDKRARLSLELKSLGIVGDPLRMPDRDPRRPPPKAPDFLGALSEFLPKAMRK